MYRKICVSGNAAPRKYIFLAVSTLFLAVTLLSLGLVTFTFTPSYHVGTFWTSFMLFASGAYNITLLCLRLFCDNSKFIKRHKRKLGMISSTLSVMCFISCLIGTILDFLAAYLLHRTDFTQCAYTSSSTTVPCSSPTCPSITLQARTCYCCYLYASRTQGGCHTPMYLAKQTYFSGVESCSDISNTLKLMLSSVGAVNLVAAIVSVIYVFQNRLNMYHGEKECTQASSQQKDNSSNKIAHTFKIIINYLKCRTLQTYRANDNIAISEEATRGTDIVVTNESS